LEKERTEDKRKGVTHLYDKKWTCFYRW